MSDGKRSAAARSGAVVRAGKTRAITSGRAGAGACAGTSDEAAADMATGLATPEETRAEDACKDIVQDAAGRRQDRAAVVISNGDDTDTALVVQAAKRRAPSTRRRAPQREPIPWSEEREATFLETLGMTCSVANAIRASGLSSASIYRRRAASDTFRAGWAAAVREGYVRLETEMLRRAIHGVRKPRFYAGKKVGSVREYADRGALALLGQYRAMGHGGAPPTSPQAEARVVLIEVLARMNRGMGGDG
jgi:hypothetical protein